MPSSRDDDASDQDVVRVGDFFATAFHVFNTEVDGLANVREGFRNRFSLGIATRNGRADHYVTAVVGVGLEEDFEIAGGHWTHRSGEDSSRQHWAKSKPLNVNGRSRSRGIRGGLGRGGPGDFGGFCLGWTCRDR